MKKTLLLFALIFLVNHLFAGWLFIEKKTNPQGLTTFDTIVVQNNKMRSGSKEATYIYDLDNRKITVMNNFFKTYWCGSPEQYREGVINGLKEQMELIVSKLPKEKQAASKAKLEAIVQEMQNPNPQKSPEIAVDVKKIIDKISVLGYNTQRHEFWIEGKKKLSVWISERILINNDFNLEKFNQLMKQMMSNNPKLAIKSSSKYIDVLKKGYPLKSIEYLGNGEVASELIVAQKGNFSNSLFLPSAVFKAVSLPTLIKSMKIKG